MLEWYKLDKHGWKCFSLKYSINYKKKVWQMYNNWLKEYLKVLLM